MFRLVLYADVLFLIDFSMDAVSLYMTSRFTHAELKVKRAVASASFGAVVSVICTALGVKREVSFIISIFSAVIMCLIGFGTYQVRRLLKYTAVLISGEFLLGGIMTSIMSHGNRAYTYSPQAKSSPKIAIMLFGVAAAAALFFILGKVKTKKSTTVSFSVRGESFTCEALVDSGNLLRDPFSGLPVIVMSYKAAPRALKEARDSFQQGAPLKGEIFRLIPASGIGGDSLMVALKPERIKVEDKPCSAMIACAAREDGEIPDCIVPEALLY